MSKNIYEQIQKNGYSSLGTDIACTEICLKTLIKLGKITNEQRIEFLSGISAGDSYELFFEKFNKLYNSITY